MSKQFDELQEEIKNLCMKYSEHNGILVIAVEDETAETSVSGTFCIPCAAELLLMTINDERLVHGNHKTEEYKTH